MVLKPERVRLNHGPKVHWARPAADPLFISAAQAYGERVIGLVLSGGDNDGAEGLRAIKQHGGRALVQKPKEAVQPSMPEAAIARDHPDACLSVGEIAKLMETLR
jgi:two-component system chemotaxis response regulator CheB